VNSNGHAPVPDLLAAALSYAEQGWPVLPLKPQTKLPATARGFHDASTDPAQVGSWWAAVPEANIGLVCGIGFDVLDVDGDEGAASLGDLGLDLDGVLCAETPHGLHYYFRPSGVGRRIGFLPGLDWLAAGGYVVAPCSQVRDRRPYRWVTAPHVERLQPAPEAIAGLLVVQQSPTTGAAPLLATPTGKPGLLGLLVLEDRLDEIRQASNGTRNTTLFRVGRGLYGHVAAGQLDQALVRAGLTEAGLAVGLPPEEVKRTVESAEDIGMAAPLLIAGSDVPDPDEQRRPPAADETATTLAGVEAFLRRYVVFQSDAQVTAVALWVLHTHGLKAFDVTPYLSVRSAEKRSGKTRLLEMLKLLTPRARKDALASAAAVFRTIAEEQPTLLLDEVDRVFGRKGDEAADFLIGVLNAGFEAGTTVPRVSRVGNRTTVERYETFCAKALGGIGKLPETLADRSIPIVLQRKKPSDSVARFRRREAPSEASGVYEAVAYWAEGAIPTLESARPDLPDALHDRAADIWEPLFAIADLAGSAWGTRARAAAVELHGEDGDDTSDAVLLLSHIREAFDAAGEPRLPTEELLRMLVNRDDGPWARWWADDLGDADRRKSAAAHLSRVLRPFGVQPDQLKIGKRKVRGYDRAWFEDAWERYCPTGTVVDWLGTAIDVGTTVLGRSDGVTNDDEDEPDTAPDQGSTVVPTFRPVPKRGRSVPPTTAAPELPNEQAPIPRRRRRP
jgi:hypothetical protein